MTRTFIISAIAFCVTLVSTCAYASAANGHTTGPGPSTSVERSFSKVFSEVEGRVDTFFGDLILLETGQGKMEVVLVGKDAALVNYGGVYDLRQGNRMRVRYTEVVAGVKVAQEVALDPVVSLPEPSMEMSAKGLLGLMESGGRYLLVDARPVDRYMAGHLPTAVSSPFEGGAVELPVEKDTLVVFYSEDMRDPLALVAAKAAGSSGYNNVKVFKDGHDGWLSGNLHTVVDPAYLRGLMHKGASLAVVDTRASGAFSQGHIPGAYSMPEGDESMMNDVFPIWRGPGPVFFYGEGGQGGDKNRPLKLAKETSRDYMAQGEAPVHVLAGGMEAWRAGGAEVELGSFDSAAVYEPGPPSGAMDRREFRRVWDARGGKGFILDVRQRGMEFEFVKKVPLQELVQRMDEVPKDREIVIFCSFGTRARIAYYILINNGYRARYYNGVPMIEVDGTLK